MPAGVVSAAVVALTFALAGDAAVLLADGGAGSTLRVPQDYLTIQAAINAAAEGDVVSVAPGTYHEAIDNHAKAITIESTGGAGVTTIDAGNDGSAATLSADPGETPVLRGFTLTNGKSLFGGGGITTTGGPVLIENNTISGNHDCGGSGTGILASSSSATIRGNTITNNVQQGCPVAPEVRGS